MSTPDKLDRVGNQDCVESSGIRWSVPHYIKGLALGIPIYCVAIHIWAWILIVPYFLRDGRPDFRQIYSSAYMVRNGDAKQLYDYNAQKALQDRVVSPRPDGLPFIRPAYEAAILSPLSNFSFRTAYFLFVGFNIVLLATCWVLLRPWLKNVKEVYWWLPGAMLLGFGPIALAFIMGQDSVLLLAILISAFVLLTKRLTLRAGIVAGMGLFKFQVLLPVAVLFFAWRRWRFLLGFSLSATILAACSVWVAGIPGTLAYLEYLTSIANLTPGTPKFQELWFLMGNLHALVFCLATERLPKFWIESITILLSFGTLVWTYFCGRKVQHADAYLLLLALPCSILVGHYAYMHDLSVLLLPILVVMDKFLPSEPHGPKRQRLIAFSAALMFAGPLVQTFFPAHTYFVAVFVGVLLVGVAAAIEDPGWPTGDRPESSQVPQEEGAGGLA